MRRTLAGLVAFTAFTGMVLVLPVYAAPLPDARPVETSIEEIELGSVAEPEGDAVVTQDGAIQPDGVDGDEPAGEGPAGEGPAGEEPAGEEPAGEEPAAEEPATAPVPVTEDVAESGAEIPGVPALTISRPDTDPFETVGVTWRDDPAVGDVTVQLRVEQADGSWGEWSTLAADDIEQTDSPETADHEVRAGTPPYWTGRASGVEVVVQGTGDVAPEDVTLALLDPGTSEADSIPAASGPTDQANAAEAMPRVHTRAEWGADESIRAWDPQYVSTIKAATVHHTADRNNYTAADVPAMMRSIYTYHAKTRGWGDIGYNVIVDRFGRVFEGRYGGLQSTVVGAHSGGFNSYTFGVSMLGNYDVAPVPQATVDAVSSIIAWKFSLFGVDPAGTTVLTSGGGGTARYAAGTRVTLPTVFGHRDVGNTSCPGQYGYSRLAEVRTQVTGRMSAASNPKGSFDDISVTGQWVTVRGWAIDPDTTGPVTMHVYADGANVVAVTPADRTAEGVSGAHAFTASFPLVFGSHSVCVYALNVGAGTTNPHLGCKTVVVDPAAFSPKGGLDTVSASGRDVTVNGWATDPDTGGSIVVHVYVDGLPATALRADRPTSSRGDHGYATTLRLGDGAHSVCTYAINVGQGTGNTHLGCRSVTVSMAPVGALDSVASSGRQVTLRGWAKDPDAPGQAIQVHVYVDGNGVAALHAGQSTYGGHGYAATLQLSGGTHSVCTYAINVGEGSSNTHLGCRSVEVSMNPIGALTGISLSGADAVVRGWAVDPDVPTGAIFVHVYVDGVPAAGLAADRAASGVNGSHAFEGTVPLRSPGSHTVCAYAINVGEGDTNPHLGCRSVTVTDAAFNPRATMDAVRLTGPTATVSGHAADPDGRDPLQVHVYVDGVGQAVLLADGAAASDGSGRRYSGEVRLSGGAHTICGYAINQGHGTTNPHLGCEQVNVTQAAFNPLGALSSVTSSGGQVMVNGWASDPDAPAATVTVHVYVDGVGVAILAADRTAEGVSGPHAYADRLALSAGRHQVCTYAINVGTGTANTHLGCAAVTV